MAKSRPVGPVAVELQSLNAALEQFARAHDDMVTWGPRVLSANQRLRAALAAEGETGAPCEPVGLTEIGERLKVKAETVQQWRQREVFTLPEAGTISGRPWWRWSEVVDWAIAAGKMPA